MDTFLTRLSRISEKNGRIILANDYNHNIKDLTEKTLRNINMLNPFLCGIKLNFHLLLPLGHREIAKINDVAHSYALETIADIKLNDIGNTNDVTTEHLWDMGFDAVIVNPVMGPESMRNLTVSAHKNNKGVISLCHMSAPEAMTSYEMGVMSDERQLLYQIFLEWAVSCKVDGIIVGATFPKIIQECAQKSDRPRIFSPGVGTQGGDVQGTLDSGSDYLIVGRTILNSADPEFESRRLHLQSLGKPVP